MDRMYKGVLSQAYNPTTAEINGSYMVVNAGSAFKALLQLQRQFDESDESVGDMYISVYRWSSKERAWRHELTRRMSAI